MNFLHYQEGLVPGNVDSILGNVFHGLNDDNDLPAIAALLSTSPFMGASSG